MASCGAAPVCVTVPNCVPLYALKPVKASTVNVAVANTPPAPDIHMSAMGPSPYNYLALNIVALFCCFIPGIIGLMLSLKVESEWKRGNCEVAYNTASWAKLYGIASIITGVIILVGFAILTIILLVVLTLPTKS